jgi:8-hydroxy-5-deazaflavin:NADPH oxidoreductase
VNVGIIGAGNIGLNLARQWSKRGHDVFLSFKRNPTELELLAAEIGTRSGAPSDAAAHGEAVLLAVPWAALDEVAAAIDVNGKVLIDATNPFVSGGLASLPDGLGGGAANSARFSGSRLVKAFNTYTSRFQARVGDGDENGPVAMFLSGADADAKRIAATLVRDAGFEPVDLGGIRQMVLMEAPRRAGAVFGEAYRPEDARTVAAAASDNLTKAARLAITLKLPGA